jgi:hypothetical protein
MPGWLFLLSALAVLLGIATAVAIAVDVVRRPQPMAIMNVVWPITGLYFPVVGWRLYRRMGRGHGDRPMWQGVLLSALHCASGCVLGNIIGAPIVFAAGWTLFGKRLFGEYVVEFALAYLFGIAFQYFPIREMGQLSPGAALRYAVKADTLSLIAFEIGMFGWMAVASLLIFAPRPPAPDSIVFWCMMQIAMLLGLATTYPANWLLIRNGIKSAM